MASHRSPARQRIHLKSCGDRSRATDGQPCGVDAAIAGLCDAARRPGGTDVVKAPPWISFTSGCGPNVEQECPVVAEGLDPWGHHRLGSQQGPPSARVHLLTCNRGPPIDASASEFAAPGDSDDYCAQHHCAQHHRSEDKRLPGGQAA